MAEGAAPVAFVTGASAGTGREIALALAGAGYDVALVGRRTEALEAVATAIGEHGRDALVLPIELRDAAAVETGIDAFLAWSGGRCDVVVNAAGIPGPLSPDIGGFGVAEFDAVIATNLRAPFLILSRLLPVMRARKSGRIINIGGNHGMRGRAGRSSYSSSKWGLRGLSRSAALEAGKDNVTVNYIAPGPIAVQRMKDGWAARGEAEGASEDAVRKDYVAAMGIALGRTNEPADIVATVLFLVGPGGRNITGQEIVIDGGVIV
ncbi:SDR family NAD(P)-dependent oxidoreductase [Flavisphingomonas formosensis]|uniref:SDR family NAD(P)-dependent oxidoreductase n=1 Tax=Flavisphingomonas formosensis TaxID=861534 RepID=UPI0012FBEB5C|nr:SDR family NAD(P)-dependent oxidoreductase [Sphingomonas formosensis]